MGNFTMISNELIERGGLSPQELAVYVALSLHVDNKTRRCNPGFTRLGVIASVSRETVKRSIKALEARGVIKVERKKVGGRNYPNVYTLPPVGSERAHSVGAEVSHVGSQTCREWAQTEPRTRRLNKTSAGDAKSIPAQNSKLHAWLADKNVTREEYELRKTETGWLDSLRGEE